MTLTPSVAFLPFRLISRVIVEGALPRSVAIERGAACMLLASIASVGKLQPLQTWHVPQQSVAARVSGAKAVVSVSTARTM